MCMAPASIQGRCMVGGAPGEPAPLMVGRRRGMPRCCTPCKMLCMLRQVGALEYDPELIEQQHHRSFLRDKVVFKEVVPIQDAALRAKIHQTYRLAYLKDVVLPRVLDDATFATFSSLILFNNVEASVPCWVSSAVHWSHCSDALGLILMRSLLCTSYGCLGPDFHAQTAVRILLRSAWASHDARRELPAMVAQQQSVRAFLNARGGR